MSDQELRLIPVALAWLAVVYKLPTLAGSHSRAAARALWLSLLLFAAAITILVPNVYLLIDELTHVSNLSRLLAHILVVLASCSSLAVLIHLSLSADQARLQLRRATWLALAVILMLVMCFALAHPNVEEPEAFTERYADSPFIDAYRLAFISYVGIMLTALVRLSWQYRGVSRSRPSLHLGLTIVTLGGLAGLGYVAEGVAYLFARLLPLGYPISDQTTSTVLGALGVSLVVVGATMPEWGSVVGIPRAYRWFQNWRACRRLYPLWRDISRAIPEIALEAAPSAVADAVAVRNLGFRLYRRVVEIRDGRLAIAERVPPGTAERAEALGRAAGLLGDDLLAVVEAACFRAAFDAPRAAEPGNDTPLPTTAPGLKLDDEVEFLQRVAHAYAQSGVVRAGSGSPD